MNKMGLYQRFWCLFVTIVLMLTAAGIFPDYARKSAQARGMEDNCRAAWKQHTEAVTR